MQIEWTRNEEVGGRPVYLQIAAAVRAAIARNGLGSGARLPAIRDLARELGVHRDTVATAYEALAADGVIESAVGRGTFVAPGEAARQEPVAPFAPALAPVVERLLEFDRARPRFGSARDAVAMHALIPDPSLYPAEPFRRALNRALARGGPELLLYGSPQGDAALREVLAKRMTDAALPVSADELVLCHGASQGIALALRLFCEAGDAVAVEEPTYNNVLGAALALGVRTAPVPMRDGGADLARLEQTLARPDVKALYTIPTFHNPMGTTTGLAHRQSLLAIARRAGVPVIEDGYEMDLRFAGAPIAPLAGLDPSGIAVHLFSFSKSLFPGARVGAVSARGRLREALLALKQASDLSDALPLQAALSEFVASGEYDRHLARLRRVLRGRRDALLEALAQHMPEGAHWTTPEGGYQIWLELPGPIDTRDLLADAVAQGVLFAPGSQFFSDGRPSNGMRLAFAMAGEDALRRGVERIARVVAAHRANGAPAARVPV
ncbi:MAG TPA: PLP-dependent aminotransferase family protein [Myxococcota bacterium]|nr:PLP-dependent aminotransferase family protein [Myxococcota bacterium]